MNKMRIPHLGDRIVIEEDWSFHLHSESRNGSLGRMLVGDDWTWGYGAPGHDITLPAGTSLTIDRIYIRKGASAFDSVTFNLINHPGKSKKGFGRVRFWAKLDDVNRIVYSDLNDKTV